MNLKEKKHLQEELAKQLRFNPVDISSLRLAAGADIAYWKDGDTEYGVCSVVIVDIPSLEVLETGSSWGRIEEEYIPGLLSFREIPLIMETFGKIRHKPDVALFDGNGYLHPRHMGIASQASFSLNLPTIGVAKTFYHYADVDYIPPEDERGAWTDIVIDGECCGRTLRSRKGVKPIFVSAGNGIDLESAVKVVLSLVKEDSRLPLPVRLADLQTKRQRRLLSAT